METIKTDIEGLEVLIPRIYSDERGYFMESYKNSFFEKLYPNLKFIQDNESKSIKGVLRGLHFQTPPYEQTKLVRVISGEVLDVAVDLRKSSKTYGKHFSIILSESNKKQLLIPKGFAHGFVVLSDTAIFSYKVDNEYFPENDSGINYDDPDLSIDWKLDHSRLIVSKKDKSLKYMSEFKTPFN